MQNEELSLENSNKTREDSIKESLLILIENKTTSFSEINDYFLRNKFDSWIYLNQSKKEILIKKAIVDYKEIPIIGYNELRSKIAVLKEKQNQFVLFHEYFLAKYSIKTSYYTKEIWIYNDGIFKPDGEAILLEIIHEIIPHYSKQNRNEILDKIRISTLFIESPFDKQNIIVLKNGVINLEDSEIVLYPHSEDFLSTKKINAIYNPEAININQEIFFSQITKSNYKFKAYLYEVIADCLTNHYQSEKAHLFVGDGRNGKGTFLRLIEKLFDNKNISHLGLNQLTEKSFQLFTLQNSYANIVGDTSDRKLTDTGIMKKAIGEDIILCDIKHAIKPIEFLNTAKFIISGQYVPQPSDEDTYGWYRRFIISDWQFEILDEMITQNFEKSLHTQEEISGLLNKVLNAYKLFKENNFVFDYNSNKTREDSRHDYLLKSDPVKVFIEKYVIEDPELQISRKELYNNFVLFSQKLNIRHKTDVIFGKDLKKVLPNLASKQIEGIRYHQEINMSSEFKELIRK